MNLILLFPDDFITSSRVRLEGRRLVHVREVHRAAAGDELCVGLADGKTGTGKIISLGDEFLEMDVHLTGQPPSPLPLTLILALPRPKVLRRVLRSATTMGVKRIILLNSSRVEKSYWQTPFLSTDEIRHQLVLGLEQSCDTNIPDVRLEPLFRPFVEDRLPGIIKGTRSLLAHQAAAARCPRSVSGNTTLVIGPEGGFVPYEIEKLSDRGCEAVSLGARILPVETAIPVLIGTLFQETGPVIPT